MVQLTNVCPACAEKLSVAYEVWSYDYEAAQWHMCELCIPPKQYFGYPSELRSRSLRRRKKAHSAPRAGEINKQEEWREFRRQQRNAQ